MVSEKTLCVSLAIFFVLCFLFSISFYSGVGSHHAHQELESRSSVKTISLGVYSDSRCSIKLDSISWGEMEAGTSRNESCYIRNEGKASVSPVLSTASWNPSSAAEFISLTWNYNGKPIPPSKIVAVIFTLTVSNGTSSLNNFTFDTVISV